ncbi:MAG: Gfo/Idh/MocA family oxidoreductase [Candidatus Hydrogenedentota bacterium]
MTDKIRWGVLGTGHIAREFAKALRSLDDADIVAVGSRARTTANAFADAFAITRRHASYAALADDPGVDIVYVATPHALHRDNSIRCLEGGKAVLCEKPFAINRRQAEEVFRVAAKCNRFIMEAMWMRFIPAVRQAMAWIAEGAIGDVRMVQASFGFRDDAENLFNPDLGGGSLLDVGIYPITLAHMAFGRPPTEIRSLAALGRNGVDEQAGMVLGFDNGGLAVLASAIQTNTPHDASIMGTDGMITLHDSFWNATRVSLQREGAERLTRSFPLRCNGYEYEAEEAQTCLRAGRLESSTVPHRATLEIMSTMDTLRAQWGLQYPMEI